ncbi:PAS domain-containing protein [Pedobacter sp. Leaf132]|uniref:PAS domain-containing protein n=1 Tax=Pedobacter sp. Leaf132 TaxID=2876557 RepID=UPI001E6311C0|nr:PAS domain-containing protein [Pedobacter sp. Leaf132]
MINNEQNGISDASEMARIVALEHFKITGTPPEPAFDELTKLAADVFNVPIAAICFITKDTLHYKSTFGLDNINAELSTIIPFNRAVNITDVTVTEDFWADKQASPDGTEKIRFYASAPITTINGFTIGTFCLMDYQPRQLDARQKDILKSLGKIVMDRVELRLQNLNVAGIPKQKQTITPVNPQIFEHNSELLAYHEQVLEANNLLESVLDSYERLFKSAPIPIGICSGADKQIWQGNNALHQLFGVDEGVLIGKALNDIIIDANGNDFVGLLDEVFLSRKPYHAVAVKLRVLIDGNQKTLYANLSLQPVARMGDEPDNIMFIIADVSEETVSKLLIQEANTVLMNAIEATGMGYTVVHFATGNMTSNDQLKNNYGYKADEDFNYPDLLNTILAKYKQRIKDAVKYALDNNSIYSAEYEVKWKDGSTHWIRGFGKPVYDENGKATHIIGLNKIIDNPQEAEN